MTDGMDAPSIGRIHINPSVPTELYAKPYNYHYYNNELQHLYTAVCGVRGVGT